MSISIRPLCGQLLLQVLKPADEELRNGIIVRGRALREGFRRALVKRLPNAYGGDLVEGQEVLLPPYAGREVILNGDTLVFVREEKLEAVMEI